MAPKTGSSDRFQNRLADAQLHLVKRERQFQEACNQIILMNIKLQETSCRYNRAKVNNQRSHRYQLRLRLAVIEGVRNMYYDFATRRATEIQTIRQQLLGHVFESDEEEDSEGEL